ncbi:hypothetical protein [Streptomyces sp. A1547]|uniref:hypothetical protein n=1 Tax=Streptomyces sp. A1547 TaxID=2563105 RepID=UPI00109E71A6|nr:hypothetical protein [Streptomyces sp. A1547]THA38140.1 hypothetical protein E6W17_16790 [Streptomyces sp. A1547]
MDKNPFEAFPEEPDTSPADFAQHMVQVWAEAVIRQAGRAQAIRKKDAIDDRNFERNEEWSPDEEQLAANYRLMWAEEHMLVWSAYQLEQWRGRLAKERGQVPPPENRELKLVRDALEHLSEARLDDLAATSPSEKGPQGRALRQFPNQSLGLYLGGTKLFELLDPHRVHEEALKVVKSIETELLDRARDAYEAMMHDEWVKDR